MDLALTQPNDAPENRLLSLCPKDLVAEGGRAQAGFERVVGLGSGIPPSSPMCLNRRPRSFGSRVASTQGTDIRLWILLSGLGPTPLSHLSNLDGPFALREGLLIGVHPDISHPRWNWFRTRARRSYDGHLFWTWIDAMHAWVTTWACRRNSAARMRGAVVCDSVVACGARGDTEGLWMTGGAPSFSALCGTRLPPFPGTGGVPCNSIQTTLGLSWFQFFPSSSLRRILPFDGWGLFLVSRKAFIDGSLATAQ
ncbi:hypothetical protein DFH09DRAFT_1177475 [Mycena vulgaris]|nr:hypothetical protein DFH09DRAFT_1177475 [Mycena vulgaris]